MDEKENLEEPASEQIGCHVITRFFCGRPNHEADESRRLRL